MTRERFSNRMILIMESWGKGGTETYVEGLVHILQIHGVDVSLVLLRRSYEETIDFLSPDRVFVTGFVGLAQLLRRVRPGAVNLHLYTNLLPVVMLCKALRYKTITTLHMPLNSWGLRHRYYWRFAIFLSSHVVGVSTLVLEQLSGRNVYKHPLPGGVDSLFFDGVRMLTQQSSDEYSIIAMGRLSVEKDWPTLIDAVAQLPDSMRGRVVVEFYGSGRLREDLELLTIQKGVRAVFHGYVDKVELVDALGRAGLSVLPSRFEGLGLSAIEGMAAGVPTITANFAAAHDFIEHGVTGHMFPIGYAPALAKLIEWHISHPVEAEVVGLAGRERIRENFSEEVTYRPYIEILRQAVSSPRAV